ncbi:hypothetical protein, conserved [Eimeria praecox]|uniref:SET domain-containing protein n=1 Tax=Eimeria praecox TaxID=51316 RepID=U6GEU1_9EIME|nr:hypothetical protein, conserved [Eimeria praecox]
MSTSLLFQHLQQAAVPALHRLQASLCSAQCTGDVAQLHGSNTKCACDVRRRASSCRCSSTYEVNSCKPASLSCSKCSTKGISFGNRVTADNSVSAPSSDDSSSDCSKHADCLAHRILSLSTPLVPPLPPYSVDSNGVLRSACSITPNSPNSSLSIRSGSSCAGTPEEGFPSHGRICSIDSVSLASAAFVPSLFSLLRELWEASDTSDWLFPLKGPGPPRRAVALEVWKLRPSAELSSQLKLWGNAALAHSRPAAAASLYTAGVLLLPSTSNSNTPNSTNPLAVLCANASLALLQLRRGRRALRTATEAVLADPMYRKAWHRRAAALVQLREEIERYFLTLPSSNNNNSSSSSSSGSTTSRKTNCCSSAALACLQQIDKEIAEAQMMSKGQVSASEAATAASRLMVGRCGCGHNAASCPSSDGKDSASHSPGLWLRRDVRAQLDAKGLGLVTANDALCRLENDPCLVLEEEAFAVYVQPNLCADIPKIPFLLPSYHKDTPAQTSEGLKLLADASIRNEWEERVEEEVGGKNECKGNDERRKGHDICLEIQEQTEGVCAGCATVPARGKGVANECHLQAVDTWQSSLNHLLYPTLPVVPCGSCAAAMFCCHGCRAASSHKRACRLQRQHHLQWQEACGMVPHAGRNGNRKGTGGRAAESTEDTLVQPLALALPDPHRCIAHQLLASLLPPAAASEESAEGEGSTALVEEPYKAVVESTDASNFAGLRMLGDPPWRQLLMRASSVVVDSTRVADWLLNAAWLAGEAAAGGRGLQCGGRCLICRSAEREIAPPSHTAFATAASSLPTVAAGSEQRLDEAATRHLRSCCCECCRPWCPKCSSRSPSVQDSDDISRCGAPFPRCLFSAALHAYGVSCCNSFTIRVLCDPEEEAVAAGTAVFLAASLLNHSCAPSAIAVFGEPTAQVQGQQQRDQERLRQHQHGEDGGCAAAQYADLLPSPRGLGRGTLLQVRLCAQPNSGGNGRLQELCISYGPAVGLPKSSWGFRQDWLLKHAGFFCRCEACVPPRGSDSEAGDGEVAFRYELLRFLEPHLPEISVPPLRLHKLVAGQATSCSFFSRMPAKTLEFVAALSKLLLRVLAEGQMQPEWTSTQVLALLGHSCAPLWLLQAKAFPDSSAIMSSFLGKGIPVYAFSELWCLNCNLQFPASVLEKNREAIHVQLDRMRSALRILVSPFSKAAKTERADLLTEALKDIVQAIPQVVAVSGCLSTDVWQALQCAARAAHAQAEVMRQAQADSIRSIEPLGMAATWLLAGIYVLLQRLPLGLFQPEVCAHMYKAAVLLGQVGGRAEAKQILASAIQATLNSCGPHSVSQSYLKEYLRWLEREYE